jgi:hypothetical protein
MTHAPHPRVLDPVPPQPLPFADVGPFCCALTTTWAEIGSIRPTAIVETGLSALPAKKCAQVNSIDLFVKQFVCITA